MRFLTALTLCFLLMPLNATAAEKDNFDAKPLLLWVGKAAAQTYSFSFLTFDNDMAEASKNFTPEGWSNFKKAMEAAKVPEAVQAQHQLVTTLVVKPPQLLKHDTSKDTVEMTIASEYQSGADISTSYMKLQLVVEEGKTPGSLAIAQWIASPIDPPPDEAAPLKTAKQESQPKRICGEVGKMQKMLMQQQKLAFLGTSIDSNEVVHIYFRSNIDERWAEMEMDDNLQACIVREGYDFHFMMGNRSPAKE